MNMWSDVQVKYQHVPALGTMYSSHVKQYAYKFVQWREGKDFNKMTLVTCQIGAFQATTGKFNFEMHLNALSYGRWYCFGCNLLSTRRVYSFCGRYRAWSVSRHDRSALPPYLVRHRRGWARTPQVWICSHLLCISQRITPTIIYVLHFVARLRVWHRIHPHSIVLSEVPGWLGHAGPKHAQTLTNPTDCLRQAGWPSVYGLKILKDLFNRSCGQGISMLPAAMLWWGPVGRASNHYGLTLATGGCTWLVQHGRTSPKPNFCSFGCNES